MVKTIIFDYDGTIHNTLGIYEPAFREAYQWLSEQKVVEEQKIEPAQIAGWLGLNSKEMWDTFLPELDQRYKDQASAIVGDSMVRQIRKHRAVWYPGADIYGIGSSVKAVVLLDNGNIQGLVVPDAYEIGYKSVGEMAQRLEHRFYRLKGHKTEIKVFDRDEFSLNDNMERFLYSYE